MNRAQRTILEFAMVLSFALSGCAKVYHRPPASVTVAERHQIYEDQKANYDWFNLVRVNERHLPLGARSYPSSVAKYYEAGGDTRSAQMAKRAVPYYAWAFGAALAGILGSVAIQNSQGWDDPNWLGLSLGASLGVAAEITIIYFGNEKHIKPSTETYNQYLRRDLRVEGGLR